MPVQAPSPTPERPLPRRTCRALSVEDKGKEAVGIQIGAAAAAHDVGELVRGGIKMRSRFESLIT